MFKSRVLSAVCCLILVCCASGCSIGGSGREQATENVVEDTPAQEESVEESPLPDEVEEPPTEIGTLLSAEDINLHAVDEAGTNYVFSYRQEEFSARYTYDNWKIIDSYKITDTEDITVICQALLNAHAVHGRDMESFRTPEDMAFEWVQHNFAYEFLPDDNPWKRSAKDVDLNPADQGKTFLEMYEDRTGKKIQLAEFLG